jgi:hypothetical protein
MNFSIKHLLWIGIAVSIIVGIGEYLLHYLPEGSGGEIAMLRSAPELVSRQQSRISVLLMEMASPNLSSLLK